MKPKNVIVWILLLGIVVLLMSTSVQAWEEVNATAILEKIENGEDIYHENVHIVGELDLSEIKLKIIPNTRTDGEISLYDLEEELKIVESKIEIHDSVFEDDVDFSNTQFRKDIDFSGTSFLGKIKFGSANFAGNADFGSANFTGNADFGSANFAGNASFGAANFAGNASFGAANFAGNASFGAANFAGNADFRVADFSGDADFMGATFTNVFLCESDFNRMKVEWNSLKDALVFNGPMGLSNNSKSGEK